MPVNHGKLQKNKVNFIAAFVLLIFIAFMQCYNITKDLTWAAEPDFDRDISYVQSVLDGQFGKDPSYVGAYIWYNPLLFSVETAIVKLSGLPIHVVVTQAGIYLNLLGPILFAIMMVVLFDYRVALASLLSYLFLSAGDIPGWAVATYSPWLYPVCFAQFLFYLCIIFCYFAFSRQRYIWFFILGATIGICFLGHTAPAVVIILIMISLQSVNMFEAFRQKNISSLYKYLKQGLATFIPFILVALPFLFFIVGKYHLHFVNRMISQFVIGIFIRQNYLDMITANLSVSLVISFIGFIWFYKNFREPLIRRIILAWLFSCLFMFAYTSIVPGLENTLHIYLPVTVPSFHYFFYLKALQSVFFGFGLVYLLNLVTGWIGKIDQMSFLLKTNIKDAVLILAMLASAIIYFPYYQKRDDFTYSRGQALLKQRDKDAIEVYNYIVQNISPDEVILCNLQISLFPVMPTARKLVAIHPTFSNPYCDFASRNEARNDMLLYLRTGEPQKARRLFSQYQVGLVLLPNKDFEESKTITPLIGRVVFRNNTYTLFAVKASS